MHQAHHSPHSCCPDLAVHVLFTPWDTRVVLPKGMRMNRQSPDCRRRLGAYRTVWNLQRTRSLPQGDLEEK